jgi:hypothetical protein
MSDPYYVLNQNAGIDVVHVNPREECNVDDAEGRQTIDAVTADAMLANGSARRCSHCNTEEPS